jgi:hypothetical protein
MQNDALQRKVETGEFIEKNSVLAEMSWGTTATWTETQINTALDEMVNTALENYNVQGRAREGDAWVDVTTDNVTEDQWKELIKGTPL